MRPRGSSPRSREVQCSQARAYSRLAPKLVPFVRQHRRTFRGLTQRETVVLARRKIDKAFRIAKPMRKASWTKRFAAGWGERRAANGLGEPAESGCWGLSDGVSGKSLPMRAVLEKPRPPWLENAAQGVAIGGSGYRLIRVTSRQNEDTRRATASGNCHSEDIAARPRRDPSPRRELDRPVPAARSTPPRGLIS